MIAASCGVTGAQVGAVAVILVELNGNRPADIEIIPLTVPLSVFEKFANELGWEKIVVIDAE